MPKKWTSDITGQQRCLITTQKYTNQFCHSQESDWHCTAPFVVSEEKELVWKLGSLKLENFLPLFKKKKSKRF